MTAALAAVRSAALAQWRAPRRLSLAEWADAHYVLPPGDANAGRWTTLPYQRGILDAISDPGIERVTWMKSARVGYTKSFVAAVGYFIHHDPCPILIVQPTIEDAQRHSKEDIAPMLAEVRPIRGLVSESKTRDSDSTILLKTFRGGSLALVGANSPRGFRRTSRRVIIFDEVDGYPPSAGAEGDQIELGIRRSEYYWNRKILAGSTPTVAGISRIERLFLDGDQRRYYVPCPRCDAFQVLRRPQMKWEPGHPEGAWFECVANGCRIEPRDKPAMIAAGEWRAEAPEHFTESHRYASFHIWAAYSYSPNATWGQLAAEWVRADHGGPVTLRTYVNTVLGETWQERGEAPEWERLYRRREAYPIGAVPRGALFLTAGVDVQRDRLVYEVVGWGRGKESWSIDWGTIPGDTADLARGPWPQLDALLGRTFPCQDAPETSLTIQLLAVDTGYNTQAVYGWGRGYPINRVLLIKGQDHGGALIEPPRPVEVLARGRRAKAGVKVWPVVGRIAKSELYGWLRLEPPLDGDGAVPGLLHFPEYGEAYFRELTAEHLVTARTRAGFVRMEWELLPGRRNDTLDARVYARAAATVAGLDRFTESDWSRLERNVGIEPAPAAAPAQPPPPAPTAGPSYRRQSGPWLQPSRGWLRR